ncbi:hypothetical protein [Streptomyces virginiae]|uniref:hypothetical protein n=1 Tax=Streptomyces virginiae TaxID=1961 RepID=UPI00367EDF08
MTRAPVGARTRWCGHRRSAEAVPEASSPGAVRTARAGSTPRYRPFPTAPARTVEVARGRRDNTDIPGLVAALRERGVHRVESATVLGAGATAASALAALAELGSGPVTVCVRGPERAARMRAWGERLGVGVRTVAWERAGAALTAPLVLSTTPKGAADLLARAVPGRPGALFDVVYDPWPTPLAAAWSAAGGPVLSGLDLLVHQATRQVELMTGRGPAPLARMRAVGSAALATAAAMC